MSARPVRTRFAPSPTGSLHIGGLRTALFNWMFARKHGGQFILRIEDTDQKRFDANALQTLTEALRWVGLDWDEGPEVGGNYGPYVQSERLAHYQHWAQWLVDNDKAYKCFCTPERLAEVNKQKEARKEPPGYDRHCRTLSREQIAEKEASGAKYVVRFKAPLEGKTLVRDLIRGEVEFENHTLQDMVLLKSDGFPTYHLAVVIDDYLMQISHVMRAVEWFPSFPLHVQLWQAFGWDMPEFAHLPVMLNPNGKGKMSKRNPPVDKFGNIIPVMVHDYMHNGYLPAAMLNFLANIGWNYGDDQEIFSMTQAIERFTIEAINPANSALPTDKLDWLNGHYIREMSTADLASAMKPFLVRDGYSADDALLLKVAPVVQTRMKRLSEISALAGFFFKPYDEFQAPDASILIQKKQDATSTATMLQASLDSISNSASFSTAELHSTHEALAQSLGVSNGALFGTLRVALTAQTISTPTFETMEILGKVETLRRLQLALAVVKA